jgi:hypothetical protein
MDLLDIVFRLERMFRIKLIRAATDAAFAGKAAKTLTAGDIEQLVRNAIATRTRSGDDDSFCVSCGYNLRGLPPDSRCPECGADASLNDQIWSGVREVLGAVTSTKATEIRRDSRLVADLGASF